MTNARFNKMFITNFSSHLVLFSIFQVTSCERRIVEGNVVTSEQSYVVYLVKAKDSIKTYDTWLCGGAIVTKWFILTSAACVEDVQFMYAIAGYRKYVNDRNIDKDECTKRMKKKIVYRCIPISYEFDFNKIEKWAYVDIALVKVESPYDFSDVTYQIICSYIPSPIPINYDEKRQAKNVDAMMLGWGHTFSWREVTDFSPIGFGTCVDMKVKQNDDENLNSEFLLFGSTILYDKKKCVAEYNDIPELSKIIEKYMICTLESGHVNDHGLPFSMTDAKFETKKICITEKMKEEGMSGEVCPEEELNNRQTYKRDGRKRMNLTETKNNVTNYTDTETDSATKTDAVNGTDVTVRNSSISKSDFNHESGFDNVSGFFNGTFRRRTGICQNDHGGPLVTWVGKREVLIGVASVFKISADRQCIGPYLFTSTTCNGAFLGCVLGDNTFNFRTKNESFRTSAQLCNSAPSVKGFDTIESYVSWKDHPDGPADNEKSILRSRFKAHKDTKHVKDDSEEPYANILNRKNTPQVIVPNFTPKTEEQTPNDRFSLNIGIPRKIKPAARKRPLLRKRRPPITRPQSDEKPGMSVRPDVEKSPTRRSPLEMDPRLIMSSPINIELSSTIKSSPKMEPQPIIQSPPNMDHPPNTRQEMKPSPFLSPQMFRPRLVITPHSIIKQAFTHRPIQPPIFRPLLKMGSPVFKETQDFKSEEEFMKKLFE